MSLKSLFSTIPSVQAMLLLPLYSGASDLRRKSKKNLMLSFLVLLVHLPFPLTSSCAPSGPTAISTSSVVVSMHVTVSSSTSSLQPGSEAEKIVVLHGPNDPSVSLEGGITAAETKEQETHTEQPQKTQHDLVTIKKEKVKTIKASKSFRKSRNTKGSKTLPRNLQRKRRTLPLKCSLTLPTVTDPFWIKP